LLQSEAKPQQKVTTNYILFPLKSMIFQEVFSTDLKIIKWDLNTEWQGTRPTETTRNNSLEEERRSKTYGSQGRVAEVS